MCGFCEAILYNHRTQAGGWGMGRIPCTNQYIYLGESYSARWRVVSQRVVKRRVVTEYNLPHPASRAAHLNPCPQSLPKVMIELWLLLAGLDVPVSSQLPQGQILASAEMSLTSCPGKSLIDIMASLAWMYGPLFTKWVSRITCTRTCGLRC